MSSFLKYSRVIVIIFSFWLFMTDLWKHCHVDRIQTYLYIFYTYLLEEAIILRITNLNSSSKKRRCNVGKWFEFYKHNIVFAV